jgi:hypothetical protein
MAAQETTACMHVSGHDIEQDADHLVLFASKENETCTTRIRKEKRWIFLPVIKT